MTLKTKLKTPSHKKETDASLQIQNKLLNSAYIILASLYPTVHLHSVLVSWWESRHFWKGKQATTEVSQRSKPFGEEKPKQHFTEFEVIHAEREREP